MPYHVFVGQLNKAWNRAGYSYDSVGIKESIMRELTNNGLERARLTASSLLTDIISICEKLVELHLNNWRFHDDRPMEDVNIFRDDAGTLVAELDFASYEEVPDSVMLDPRLEIMLYTTGDDGPWFQISFQLASQTF